VNIAKVIAQNFAKFGKDLGVVKCTLTKSTPGARTPGAITSGTNPTVQTFAATGLVTDYSAYELAISLVKAGDRKVLLFGGSIAGGAKPEPGDSIDIGGETLTIVPDGVHADPAQAAFICQTRK
jgi:hypothetical protein